MILLKFLGLFFMIKSVFFKYILAFLIIITISFAVLACVISSSIIQHSIETKKNSMATASKIAGQNIEASFNGSNYDIFEEFVSSSKNKLMWDLLAYTKLIENSLILITDSEGNIIINYPMYENYLQKDYVSKEIIYDILSQSGTETEMEGETESEIEWYQTLDGVFLKRHIISHQILTSKTGEICGVLFFCSGSIWDSFADQVINTIILSCIWVLAGSMVILYVITEKIISPVRAMSKAAKSFALGRFDVRIPVKVTRDEIGELASAFNNMAAELAVNEEKQRTFLSNVSHDLRTPMTTIGLSVDNILNGTIPIEKQEYYLNMVSTEIKRLSKLVYQLFEITKIQAGERKFTKTNFDICEMAKHAIIFLEQKIDEKHIELEFECDEDNMHVFADSLAIRQILDNLLENAIKFTPEKGLIKVKISGSVKENEKDKEKDKDKEKKIYVSVYNTGIGIPPEDAPFVFDRFYKSDRSRGLDKTGSGLGLFIVKTIIDNHGEKIWVNSEYEKYCEFTFTLQKIIAANNKFKI